MYTLGSVEVIFLILLEIEMEERINFPQVGTVGHIIGSVQLKALWEVERLKELAIGGCPISNGNPTRMYKQTFKVMCVGKQRRAGKPTAVMRSTSEVNGSSNTLSGWQSNNLGKCRRCGRGKLILLGREFAPPMNLEFVKEEDFD